MKNGRFIIYCVEIGCAIDSPYHRTDDQEEAEIICRDLANNNKAVVVVFDCKRDIDYYMVNPHFGKR